MLAVLCVVKVVATCLTLASGGSGGVIAPSLFLGAATGSWLGVLLQRLHLFTDVYPAVYALIGMGAVLGAVVHAPLAAILILLELTSDYHIILPAMLATIMAVGTARFIFPDSVYSVELRARGIRTGSIRDLSLLRRISVEQIGLEPASVVAQDTPMLRVLEMMNGEIRDAIVVREDGAYFGMLCRPDVEAAVLQPQSMPLLVAAELARTSVPMLSSTDDLAKAVETFAQTNVDTLAVSLPGAPDRAVGVVSRQHLLKRYHELLEKHR
jgi:CIC family chloride channel protein